MSLAQWNKQGRVLLVVADEVFVIMFGGVVELFCEAFPLP